MRLRLLWCYRRQSWTSFVRRLSYYVNKVTPSWLHFAALHLLFPCHIKTFLATVGCHLVIVIIQSGTDLISLLILLLFLLGWSLQKSLRFRRFKSDQDEVLAGLFLKWICIDWQNRIFDIKSYFYHSDHDIISHRKLLPSGECTRSVCPAHMRLYLPVPEPLYIRTCFSS